MLIHPLTVRAGWGGADRSVTWLQRKQLFPFCQEEGIPQPEVGKYDQRLKGWSFFNTNFFISLLRNEPAFCAQPSKEAIFRCEIVCEKAHVFHVMIWILYLPSFNCYFSCHTFCLVLSLFGVNFNESFNAIRNAGCSVDMYPIACFRFNGSFNY